MILLREVLILALPDLELDAAVGELGLAELVALGTGLQAGFLNGVHLQELVEVALVAPRAVVVVELYGARSCVDDDGVQPVWELDDEPGDFAAVEFRGALPGFSEPKTPAGGGDGGRVMNTGLDADD